MDWMTRERKRRRAFLIFNVVLLAGLGVLCLLPWDAPEGELTPSLARQLICRRLYMPTKVWREFCGYHHTSPKRWHFGPSEVENLTATLLFGAGQGRAIDLTPSPGPLKPSLLCRRINDNVTLNGRSTTLVREREVSQVRILSQTGSTATGEYTWTSPEFGSGRCIFGAERRAGSWALTYMAIPRRGSMNPSHGAVVFPLRLEPCRTYSLYPPYIDGVWRADDPIPPGDWHMINVETSGDLVIRRGAVPATRAQVARMIQQVVSRNECPVLRCDGRARWQHVQPVVAPMGRLGVAELWFVVMRECGECFSEAFLSVDLCQVCSEDAEHTWVVISCGRAGPSALGMPCVVVDGAQMMGWGDVRETFARLAGGAEPAAAPVSVAPTPDARFGWVMRVLDGLRAAGLRKVAFSSASPTSTEEAGSAQTLGGSRTASRR